MVVASSTHVGADRSAPNVVALPDGSDHGGLGPAQVPALAPAQVLGEGRLLLPSLRGRAGAAVPVQAAEHVLREDLGLDGLDDVQLVDVTASDAEACVELLATGRRWCVHVAARPVSQERLTSCAEGGTVGTPSSYALVALRVLA